MKYGSIISNINQIATRNHPDLQELTGRNDHPHYAIPGAASGQGNISYGLDASKPSTVAAGQVYVATDTKKWYYSLTANTWTEMLPVYADETAPNGSMLYMGASGWTVLDAGSSGQVLMTNGSGSAPSWAAALSGNLQAQYNSNTGYVLLQNAGAASVTATVFTKAHEIACPASMPTTTLNIVTRGEATQGTYNSHFRVYKNGVAVGTDHTALSTYTVFVDSISFTGGDLIQLYVYNEYSGGNPTLVSDFGPAGIFTPTGYDFTVNS